MGLDEALIREMRFDEKIRIDLPNESARLDILRAQLSKRPWKAFALDPFAKRTQSRTRGGYGNRRGDRGHAAGCRSG
jgi:SpoVK/Ycf46/Vps4 family AAA+-type ATPase